MATNQNISNLQVKSFGQNVYTNRELAGGKLRPHMTIVGGQFGTMPYRESGLYPVVAGGGLPQKRNTRFGDSPVSEILYGNRKITRAFYDDGFFIDWQDVEQITVDLKAPKLMAMNNKFARMEDIVAIKGILGAAMGGALGETSVPFASANVIPVGTGAVANTGMNYKKFLALKESFSLANVDIESGIKPVMVMSPTQYYLDLMNDDKFINSGYYKFAVAQASSSVKDFLDVTIVVMNNTPWMADGTSASVTDASFDVNGASVDVAGLDIRACFAFMPDAAMLEISPNVETAMAPVITKGNNVYCYAKAGLAATRMEEAKVFLVPCDESP
jgi:hypothetical protein